MRSTTSLGSCRKVEGEARRLAETTYRSPRAVRRGAESRPFYLKGYFDAVQHPEVQIPPTNRGLINHHDIRPEDANVIRPRTWPRTSSACQKKAYDGRGPKRGTL